MRKRFSTLSAIIGIGLIWLTIESTEITWEKQPEPVNPPTESYFEGLDQWRFGVDGTPEQQVVITSGSRPVGRPVRFKGLSFLGSDNKGRYWDIRAGRGVHKIIDDELRLFDGVEIRVPGGGAVLTTPKLMLEPGNQKAYNNSPVELVTETSVTTARGLEIDLYETTAKFLANVETIYEG
ncbi:conserved hypothetical protein [Luminiphilus syltensis NOR5-1B]|uniref:LPS export ABC transporter periplasmic protein LptC n=1 Tax=Luminiphilus syltensis NOR5-1B TaxID=565045 RepID=B8KR83_9GAMM|nr:LPS export ABC transporter periplasmic protein LptC [Luminiphilus syltensis]EED34131.1 conserved hypothetical protein [Luminiphilus syltensis NOR5-1B]